MNRLTILFSLLLAAALHAQTGTLQKVEKLTEKEQAALSEAKAKVQVADANLRNVEAQIAFQHQMQESHWMEYSTWYEFDGDFILQRYQSYQHTSGYNVSPLNVDCIQKGTCITALGGVPQ